MSANRFDRPFKDGERFDIGNMSVQVMHTPDHTPACVTYLIGDAAFIGDTLFMPDFGTARADFHGESAKDLYQSIQKFWPCPPRHGCFCAMTTRRRGAMRFVAKPLWPIKKPETFT
jgi:glyoxylase-like metal-dependent hydrolase (beta-lactamase superfamily II)